MARPPVPTIDTAFAHIAEGKKHATAMDTAWSAAENYAQAVQVLVQLEPPSDSPDANNILRLYHQQATYYLQEARKQVIRALGQDVKGDEDAATDASPAGPPRSIAQLSQLLQHLPEEERSQRTRLFSQLFTGSTVGVEEGTPDLREQEDQLAARLEQLNQSFPKSLQSEAEKVRELNRGLRRMGLATVEDGASTKPALPLSLPKSEFDQINDIIAQAKDEAELNATTMNDGDLAAAAAAGTLSMTPGGMDEDTNDSVVLLSDDDEVSIDSDDSDAALLVDELTAAQCEQMYTQLVQAQIKLSELVALCEVDAAGNAELEFDPPQGRALLKETRTLLRTVHMMFRGGGDGGTGLNKKESTPDVAPTATDVPSTTTAELPVPPAPETRTTGMELPDIPAAPGAATDPLIPPAPQTDTAAPIVPDYTVDTRTGLEVSNPPDDLPDTPIEPVSAPADVTESTVPPIVVADDVANHNSLEDASTNDADPQNTTPTVDNNGDKA